MNALKEIPISNFDARKVARSTDVISNFSDESFSRNADVHDPTKKEKFLKILYAIMKPVGLICCLYFFICSLELMSSSFRLIGGKYAGEVFQNSVILTNPLAGLMIGIVVTVVVQSSSTATSIVVSMVASEILKVKYAIPIIMGANIGTSITSTFVSFGQLGDRDEFRRAFAGATVHDMFNCLSVIVLLPIEMATGYLEIVTSEIVKTLLKHNINAQEPEMLSALTKPLTNKIVQLDKDVLSNIAKSNSSEDFGLLKKNCKKLISFEIVVNDTIKQLAHSEPKKCDYIFESLDWPEWSIGLILLIISLVTLCTCLIFMVKILNSIFQGPVAKLLQKIVNSDFPGPFKYLTSLVAILLGCVLTIIIQSSSVFTSTLTPLVGLGLIKLERIYPLTLGSNIGTTITGILAAFSASYRTLQYSLQIALCHTLFNITGIIIWFPIPFMRRVPLRMATFLGDTSSKYRWFTLVYIFGLFMVIPLFFFGLSMAGILTTLVIVIPIILLIIFVILVNMLQKQRKEWLPKVLQSWEFLPLPLRSLQPYDKFIFKYFCCFKCCKKFKNTNNTQSIPKADKQKKKSANSNHVTIADGYDNPVYVTSF